MSLAPLNAQIASLEALIQQLETTYQNGLRIQMTFPTVAALVADTAVTGGLATGSIVRILEHDGFDLEKVSGGTVHYTAASGATFRLKMDVASPMFLGAVGDDVADDKAALDAALASTARVIDLQGRTYFYDGTWSVSKPVQNGQVRHPGGTFDYRFAIGLPTLGTGAFATIGAGVGHVLQLVDDGSGGPRIPAGIDASLMDGLPTANTANPLAPIDATNGGLNDIDGVEWMLPTNAREVHLFYDGLDDTEGSHVMCRLGVAGVPVETGYESYASAGQETTGFRIPRTNSGTNLAGGISLFRRPGSNHWSGYQIGGFSNGGAGSSGGYVTLAGAANQIGLYLRDANTTFDDGTPWGLYFTE